MPSKYGIYAEDFDNWRDNRHPTEYARHLARCGKYISSYTATDIAHMKLDTYSNPKGLMCGYFPSQCREEWALNTNQNCSTSDEENQNDTTVKEERNREESGLSRDERVSIWSNIGNSYCSLQDRPTYDRKCTDVTSGEDSSTRCYSHTQCQNIAGVSSQGKINPVKSIVEKQLPTIKSDNIAKKHDLKSQGTINISARERRRAAYKKQENVSISESRDIQNGRYPVSVKMESKTFNDRIKPCSSIPQAKVTPAAKSCDITLSSPIKPFARFCKRRELSIPLRPTFPKSFSDAPQELTDLATEVLDLDLRFQTKTSVKDAGEFPFKLDIKEKRFNKGECHTSRSVDTVVKCFTKETLELHGTMSYEDCNDELTAKFIFIVKPGCTADGQVEYKGVYRRQLADHSKFISWRFHL